MASFKAKFPVLQELFAKNHRGGPFGPPPPSGARDKILKIGNLRGANFFLSVKEDGPMFSPKYGVGFISVLQLIKKIFNVECKKRSK